MDPLGSGLSCLPIPLNPTSDHKDPLASVKFVNFFSFLLLLDQADIKLHINITLEYKDPLALVKYSSNLFDDSLIEGTHLKFSVFLDPQTPMILMDLHCFPVRIAADHIVPKWSICYIIRPLPVLNSKHLRITKSL